VPEINNNLELAQYLFSLSVEKRQEEYTRLFSILKFKVKSFGYLMQKYEKWKENHAGEISQAAADDGNRRARA